MLVSSSPMKNTMEVNGDQKHSPKYHRLCSKGDRNSHDGE